MYEHFQFSLLHEVVCLINQNGALFQVPVSPEGDRNFLHLWCPLTSEYMLPLFAGRVAAVRNCLKV